MRVLTSVNRKEDREMQQGLLSGNERVLEAFYEKYFSRLYRYIFYRVWRDHHHAEEVVNDTFIEALEKIDRYDPDRGSLEAWLIMTSRNRIRSSNSTMGRAHEHETSWSMMDGELDTIFADLEAENIQESALENEDLSNLVGRVMGSLPNEYSKLLEMKYITEYSTREIANLMKKTEKAVESKLTRARAAFRKVFSGMSVDEVH